MSFPFLQPYAGLSNSLQTAQAAGGAGAVGGWVELGRTTLGSAGNSIDVTSLPDKRYYMVLTDVQSSGITNIRMRNNGDSGNNYASRYCANGGSDSTIGSFNNMVCHNQNVTIPQFMVSYGANRSSSEKLWINHVAMQNTAGAGNAPTREESVCKHAQTSNPINQITIFEGESGSFDTNSECVVLGWDPADTHTSNFWEELASVDLSGGASDLLSTGTFTAKKYLWVQFFTNADGGTTRPYVQFNNDTGSNYASRYSENGAGDATSANRTNINPDVTIGAFSKFTNMFIINNASNEKLVISHTIESNTAGAGNAAARAENVSKWANTSNQITEIDVQNGESGDFGTNSIIKVWGAD